MWKLLIFPVCAIAFFLVTFLSSYQFFYRGGYNAPVAPEIYFEEIMAVPAPAEDFTDQPVFSANPLGSTNRGTLLVDTGHRNAFSTREISTLLNRVNARGYDVEYVTEPGAPVLTEGLRTADAFLVVLPNVPYSVGEADQVVDFVERGGKVLVVADPGRPHRINSLSERLGVAFQPDYLYNLAEHDANFQEFYVRDFPAHEITAGINEMVFFYAGSIESAGESLALTDENTYSNISERNFPRSPVAMGANRNVLAVYDLTFMIPPYNAVRDNDQMVTNIAEFLTDEQKDYQLADFPGFLQGGVDILLGRPDLFDLGAEMRQVLSESGVSSEVRGSENAGRDTVFLGLYDNPAAVARYLDSAGVRIDDSLSAPFSSGIPLEGSSVLLLHRTGERDVLIVLSSTPEGLEEMVNKLGAGTFRAGLADDYAGVYKTE